MIKMFYLTAAAIVCARAARACARASCWRVLRTDLDAVSLRNVQYTIFIRKFILEYIIEIYIE